MTDAGGASETSTRWSRAFAAAEQRYGRHALTLAMLAAATYIYVWRQPHILTSPTFWAEDGLIFFKGAFEHGLGAVLTPNNGQLWLFQRIVAGLAIPLPVSIQPALYAGVAVATAVLSCSIVLSSRWRWQVPLAARFVCLLALLCSPAVDQEALGTLTNSHWWLAIGLVLLGMLYDPLSRRLKIGEVVFTAVTALSGFAAIYAIPSLGVRAYRNRSRHSVAVLGVALSGVLVQLVYLHLSSVRNGDLRDTVMHPITTILVLVRRVFGCAALGGTNLFQMWPKRIPDWWLGLIVFALIVSLAAIWIVARRLEIGALLLAAVGGWLLATWELWTWKAPGLALWGLGWRYFLVPVAILYVSLIVTWSPGAPRRALAGVACVLLAAGIMSGYHVAALPSSNWTAFTRCMEARVTTCSVVIPPAWTVTVDPRGH